MRVSILALLLCQSSAFAAMDLFGVDWDGGSYLLDSQTGQCQVLQTSSPVCPHFNDLARSPDGRLLSIGRTAVNSTTAPLVRFDPRTGDSTEVGQVSGLPLSSLSGGISSPHVTGMAFSPDGSLYVATYSSATLYRIDMSTLTASAVGTTTTWLSPIMALAFSPDGTLYGNSISDGLLRINTANGSAVRVNPSLPTQYPGAEYVQAMTFLPNGQLVGLNAHYTGSNTLYTIDVATNAPINPRPMAGLPYLRGLAVLPEPSSILLLLVFGPLCATRRKRCS